MIIRADHKNAVRNENDLFKMIYRWIYKKYLRSTVKNLHRIRKISKRMSSGKKIHNGESIRRMVKSLYNRKESEP